MVKKIGPFVKLGGQMDLYIISVVCMMLLVLLVAFFTNVYPAELAIKLCFLMVMAVYGIFVGAHMLYFISVFPRRILLVDDSGI